MTIPYDAGAAAAYDQLSGRWCHLYVGAALDELGALDGCAVLDLATGTGDAAIVAAGRVGCSGMVVGADLSIPMLKGALAKVGGKSVLLVAADATCLPFASRSFDRAVCLFGLMFFQQPLTAMRELRRVLVPGARVALTTWTTPHGAAFSGFMAEALSIECPGDAEELLRPFALGDPGISSGYLREAGFNDVNSAVLWRHGTFASLADYFRPFRQGGGRLGQFYLGLESARRARVDRRVISLLEGVSRGGLIHMNLAAVMVTGTSPG